MYDKLRVDLINNCTHAIACFNTEKERILQAPNTLLTSTSCGILDGMIYQWDLTCDSLLKEDSCVIGAVNNHIKYKGE